MLIKSIKIMFIRCLLLFFISCHLIGCSEQNRPVEQLTFSPNYGGIALNCQSIFNLENTAWHYQQLQMYVSNVELFEKESGWKLWPMKVTPYQHSNVALLGSYCGNDQQINAQSKENTNWQIILEPILTQRVATKIRFTLGVPFELNHLNPLTQPSPLNVSSMFWVWQTGHKFLRVELASHDENWLFHLGSTGCSAPSVMRAPSHPCKQPNTVVIELPFNLNSKNIHFDMAKLLAGIDVTLDTSCQSAVGDENCLQPLNNIGITGKQQVFSIEGK